MSTHVLVNGEVLLDRYRVERYLDEGGMQQVFIATDLTFERLVVLKAPKNPSAEKRFARSARLSAKITHANVAKTLDYIDLNGRNYLIEEYVQGVDLKRLLDTKTSQFDPHFAARFFHQFVKGLAASHHAHVFHRDLKPSNVMVSNDPNLATVKITDFGIAKMTEYEMLEGVDMRDHSSVTGNQTVLGALPYMAPEMIITPKGASLPADVWSAGAILAQLLMGLLPFGGGLQAIPNIISGNLPPKPALFSRKTQFNALAEQLWSIIDSCLRKDPDLRPTADQLVNICSELCYSDAPRREGRITRYKHGTGSWGFIQDGEGEDVFFHLDSFYGEKPEPGLKVNFASFPGTPNSRAFPVLPLLN